MLKNQSLVSKKESLFICIDLQAKILPVMCYQDDVIENANILLKASEIMEIPVLVTEQYPKGLGSTDDSIELLEDYPIFDKTSFSIFGCDDFIKELSKHKNIRNLFIFGIETHVCVFQSVFHAIENGYNVYLIENACSSRDEMDHEIGIEAMRNLGAKIISTEMAIFQHINSSSDPLFKQLSAIIK
jgi:nicotinamidase-related amidase